MKGGKGENEEKKHNDGQNNTPPSLEREKKRHKKSHSSPVLFATSKWALGRQNQSWRTWNQGLQSNL